MEKLDKDVVEDFIKKYTEDIPQPKLPTPHVCPHCDRCPTCGRRYHEYYPAYWPRYRRGESYYITC